MYTAEQARIDAEEARIESKEVLRIQVYKQIKQRANSGENNLPVLYSEIKDLEEELKEAGFVIEQMFQSTEVNIKW